MPRLLLAFFVILYTLNITPAFSATRDASSLLSDEERTPARRESQYHSFPLVVDDDPQERHQHQTSSQAHRGISCRAIIDHILDEGAYLVATGAGLAGAVLSYTEQWTAAGPMFIASGTAFFLKASYYALKKWGCFTRKSKKTTHSPINV